jgi:zinc protease
MAAAQATATRPAAPAAGQSTTEKFTVGGVPVILRRNAANDVVAAHLYLLGGSRQVTAENAGIEPVLLQASEAGTRRYSKEVLRQTMANLGSEIAVGADEDWSVLGLSTLREAFDSTWAVFADRLMYPRLDSVEVERVRDQFLSGVRQRRDSPDALVGWLADSLTWSGHPYATPVVGTEASLSRITVADLRRYLAEQTVTSRMLLVIVGNVERARVERLVAGTLGRLPAGSYRWTLPQAPPARPAAVVAESRPLPTNYILGYFPGPAASSPDYAALRVAAAVLSGRLFNEIRARRNLTYAVNAPFVDRAVSAGGLYVTTVYPDTTLALMRQEVENLKRGTIGPEALEQLVQQFITEFFLDNETNAAQAHFLARAELYRGDYRLAERFVDDLRAVTPEDVRRVARTYMKGLRFAYVGDPSKANLRRLEAW